MYKKMGLWILFVGVLGGGWIGGNWIYQHIKPTTLSHQINEMEEQIFVPVVSPATLLVLPPETPPLLTEVPKTPFLAAPKSSPTSTLTRNDDRYPLNAKLYRDFTSALILLHVQALLPELSETRRHLEWKPLFPEPVSSDPHVPHPAVEARPPLTEALASTKSQESLVGAIPLPEDLRQESIAIQNLYRTWVAENEQWDRYRSGQYSEVLDTLEEPAPVESLAMDLENEENRKYFLELEDAIELHTLLIRSVRSFHDEFQFQEGQQNPVGVHMYESKFTLHSPAREAALIYAIFETLSALSVGLHRYEALATLDRLVLEYTETIRKLPHALNRVTEDSPFVASYNYSFYVIYTTRLITFLDELLRAPSLKLSPGVEGEFYAVKQRLHQSLYDLYQLGQSHPVLAERLDLVELEQQVLPY